MYRVVTLDLCVSSPIHLVCDLFTSSGDYYFKVTVGCSGPTLFD